MLVKIAHGIYAKPRKSRFGVVLPSVDKVVQAIATRDNAKILPSGMNALNSLGIDSSADELHISYYRKRTNNKLIQ